MSRYRWLRPLKCIKSMEFFPTLSGKPYEELEQLLFQAVERGDVRAIGRPPSGGPG